MKKIFTISTLFFHLISFGQIEQLDDLNKKDLRLLVENKNLKIDSLKKIIDSKNQINSQLSVDLNLKIKEIELLKNLILSKNRTIDSVSRINNVYALKEKEREEKILKNWIGDFTSNEGIRVNLKITSLNDNILTFQYEYTCSIEGMEALFNLEKQIELSKNKSNTLPLPFKDDNDETMYITLSLLNPNQIKIETKNALGERSDLCSTGSYILSRINK